MLGFSIGLALTSLSPVVTIGASASFNSVDASGWTVTVDNPTDLSMEVITVSRAGFDGTGTAITIVDSVIKTKRVRQIYPSQNSFTANKVALSSYIYAADVITGKPNNSTQVSPKPQSAWGMIDRIIVGDDLEWEVIPFHRNARLGTQVACVRVQATDGTNTTPWQYVTSTTLSSSCETPYQPEVFKGLLSLTGLSDNSLITLRKQVFPHFGVAASVLDSSTETEFRSSPRYFYRNTARFVAPNIICVRSTGNDSTGVVSTNEATALATPCLTVGGAIQRAAALLGSASRNALSGIEVRVHDGVSMGTVGFVYVNQDAAAIKVTRTTASASRTAANVTMSANIRPYSAGNSQGAVLTESAILFENLRITRTADVVFQGEAARVMHTQFKNVEFNWSNTAAVSGMKGSAHLSIFGMVSSNYVNGLAQTALGDNRMIRGLSGGFNNTSIDGYCVIGCALGLAQIRTDTAQRGALIYNNYLPSPPGGGNSAIRVDTAAAGQNLYAAVVQNVTPRLTTTNDPGIMISGDSFNGNCAHVVMLHNTTPGDEGYGRWNSFYDDTSGNARSHTMIMCKANLGPQFNSKPRDTFLSLSVTPGNFATHHGVDCESNYTEDLDSAGGSLSFSQLYAGLGSRIAYGDPLYIDDRATSMPGPTAGSTGGNYDLAVGSPARGIMTSRFLNYAINGVARGAGPHTIGAYA